MKRVLLCLGCGLLSLALALGLAACGGGQTAVPTASPSQPRETPAPAETPEIAVYDDSLIADAYADAGDPATEWDGTYHYEVRIPALLCGSADAAALNAEIMAVYGAEAQRAPEPDTVKYSVGWESHWDGSLLSLELTAMQPDGEAYHDLYFF